MGVKGYFFVRQKRIPLTLCQAYSLGIDPGCSIPTLYYNDNFIAESFINKSRELVNDSSNRIIEAYRSVGTGLLALDAMVIPEIRSAFDGSEFGIYKETNSLNLVRSKDKFRHYFVDAGNSEHVNYGNVNMIYVGDNIQVKILNDYTFSTKAGNEADVSQFGLFNDKTDYSENNTNLVRGLYTPFIGVTSNLDYGQMYNIMQRNYGEQYMENYIDIRGNDTSPFFAVTDRFELNTKSDDTIEAYRGDCFTNTITIRINRNFIDPEVPTNDIIVDKKT